MTLAPEMRVKAIQHASQMVDSKAMALIYLSQLFPLHTRAWVGDAKYIVIGHRILDNGSCWVRLMTMRKTEVVKRIEEVISEAEYGL